MVYESKQKQTSKHLDLASTGKNLRPLFPLTVQDKHTICKFSQLSLLSSYKTTLKQQLNGEKWWKVRWKAKSLVCFWFSYVVFLSSAWKNCVFVLINGILRNLYVFEACFRMLAVIFVSEFFLNYCTRQVTDVSKWPALVTHSNSDDGFHDLIVYHHCCGSSLRIGQGVGQNSTNDLALVHHLSTNSRLVSQQVSQ